jgi:hypothetical protein
MAGNPFYQDVSAASPPDQVTPAAAPSSPENYAAVTPHGRGPAPYDIAAVLPEAEIAAAFGGANAAGGAGFLYPQGPRQAQAEVLLSSPQGFGADGYDIIAGYHEGGGAGWPADVEPPGM